MVTKSSREMQKDREKIRPPFGGLKFCQGTHYLPLTDETPVEVTKDGRPANSKSFMWVYRSGKYHTDRVIILYEYQKTRKAEQEEIIKGIEDGLTDKKK